MIRASFCEIWMDLIPFIWNFKSLAGGCEVVASLSSILLLPFRWLIVPKSTFYDNLNVIKQLEVIPGCAKVAFGVCG